MDDTLLSGTDSPESADTESVDAAAPDTGQPEGSTPDAAPDADAAQDTKTEDNDATPEEVVPESYEEFTMPEGVELDAALIEEATPLMKEFGLTQEKAQKAVEFMAQTRQADYQRMIDQHQQKVTGWEEAAKADKEYGGAKFEESIGHAMKALDKFGGDEVKQALQESGLGSHPEIVRMFVRLGKLVSEDSFASEGAGKEDLSPAEILYPNTGQ